MKGKAKKFYWETHKPRVYRLVCSKTDRICMYVAEHHDTCFQVMPGYGNGEGPAFTKLASAKRFAEEEAGKGE